ncbi:hypothetical protein JKP88DRAFT_242724 [Tribonema minus]|uniref:Uncharacterized protein n=1 Tax=Tribonema minus TaxID=303371 RepID=A0A835ZGQ4_9STRA|nr:hypothetical protein JKP88DRAFT_242724 [Tribonema minus]
MAQADDDAPHIAGTSADDEPDAREGARLLGVGFRQWCRFLHAAQKKPLEQLHEVLGLQNSTLLKLGARTCRDEIRWRTQLRTALEHYMPWTEDDEWYRIKCFAKYGETPWIGHNLVPGMQDCDVQNPFGVDMSALDEDVYDFFLPLLAHYGISTFQQAAVLTVESPCFEGVPPELTVRFIATLRPLRREELLLARDELQEQKTWRARLWQALS